MTAPALIEANADPFAAMRALSRMRVAGFALELDGPALVVSPADRLSESQRAFIRAHKPALVALLQDAETVYRALVQAGPAGLGWMEGTPADWTGERLLAAGEVLYGDGRMMSVYGRRYLKEHAPPFEWAGDEVAQSEEHAPAPAEPCQHFWEKLRSGVYYLVSRCTRCGKVEEFTWD